MKMETLPVFLQVKVRNGADVHIAYSEDYIEIRTRRSDIRLSKENGIKIEFLKFDKQGRLIFKKVGRTPVDVFENVTKLLLQSIVLEREPDEEVVEYIMNKIESS